VCGYGRSGITVLRMAEEQHEYERWGYGFERGTLQYGVSNLVVRATGL
jgi:hypothetical protein